MNKLFLILSTLLVSILFFSCATTGHANGSSSGTGKEEYYDPRGPQILDMGFSSSMGQSSTAITKIKSGETAVLFMRLKDSEWDLSKITVTAEKNGKQAAPITIVLNYQYEEEFVFAEKLVSPDEKGKWTFTATAHDHRGNKSKSFSTSVIVE